MRSVTAGNVVAVDPVRRAVLVVGDIGPVRRQIVQLDIAGLFDDLATGGVARRVKVFGQRGLAVGHHDLAGEFHGVDEEPIAPFPGDRRTMMRMSVAVHACTEADLAQQFDASVFQHAGANPLQHIGAALPLDHDAVDAVAIENMRQQHAGRAAADDRYLRAHESTRFPSPRRIRGAPRQAGRYDAGILSAAGAGWDPCPIRRA